MSCAFFSRCSRWDRSRTTSGVAPTILAALTLNVLAMILFMTAGSAAALIIARACKGLRQAWRFTTLAAIILDTDKERAPLS